MLVDAAKGIEDRTRKLFEVNPNTHTHTHTHTSLSVLALHAPPLDLPHKRYPVAMIVFYSGLGFHQSCLFPLVLLLFFVGVPHEEIAYLLLREQDGQAFSHSL